MIILFYLSDSLTSGNPKQKHKNNSFLSVIKSPNEPLFQLQNLNIYLQGVHSWVKHYLCTKLKKHKFDILACESHFDLLRRVFKFKILIFNKKKRRKKRL